MSRIAVPAVGNVSDQTALAYAAVKKFCGGTVPNLFAVLGHLDPNLLTTVLSLEASLAGGSLSKQDVEVIKIVVSEKTGCDYCLAAHVMLGKMVGLTSESIVKIRVGKRTGESKIDALVHFLNCLQSGSGTISESEYDLIRAAGYTEKQLFEISLVVGLTMFTNTFNRINDTVVDFPSPN